MSVGSRVFVGIIFSIIGLSFVATTAALFYEFGYTNSGVDWVALATYYSHLFVFFPVFGLLALAAFYIPCVAFTDMYWKYVPYGRFRFGLGTVLVLALSVYGAMALSGGDQRSIWEARPDVLKDDTGEGCDSEAKQCARRPVLKALASVRELSMSRTGMGEFILKCGDDPYINDPKEDKVERYCFATGKLERQRACCDAQENFGKAMVQMVGPTDNRSLTEWVHVLTLPMKLFFLFVVLIVGILLAARRHGLKAHYPAWIPKIERGVLVGAFSMLFLPVMNLAFLQTNALLYGEKLESLYRTIALPCTILFIGWALILLFFFLRDIDKDWETVGRIGGVVGSMLAVSNYELIIDYFVRFAGSGAGSWSLGALIVLATIALAGIILQPRPIGK